MPDKCPICKTDIDKVKGIIFCDERFEHVCKTCCAVCGKCEQGTRVAEELKPMSPNLPQILLCNHELRDKYLEEYRRLDYSISELEALQRRFKSKLQAFDEIIDLKQQYRSKLAAVLTLLEEKKGA